jgi:hypothetical protein
MDNLHLGGGIGSEQASRDHHRSPRRRRDGRRRPNELLEAGRGRGRRGRAREARARGGTERLVGRPRARRKAKFAEEDVPNFVQGISVPVLRSDNGKSDDGGGTHA